MKLKLVLLPEGIYNKVFPLSVCSSPSLKPLLVVVRLVGASALAKSDCIAEEVPSCSLTSFSPTERFVALSAQHWDEEDERQVRLTSDPPFVFYKL